MTPKDEILSWKMFSVQDSQSFDFNETYRNYKSYEFLAYSPVVYLLHSFEFNRLSGNYDFRSHSSK